MIENFDELAKQYVADCQEKINKHYAANYTSLTPDVLTIEYGKRYAKVVRATPDSIGKSVYAFLDQTNGDILKPASRKAPAKHARGNLTDASTWVRTTAYGPEYLK